LIPSTLTEEQRKTIKNEYKNLKDNIPDYDKKPIHYYGIMGGIVAFEEIFGKEFFKEEE